MKLCITDFYLKSLEAEVSPLLQGLNRTLKKAREERRVLKARLALQKEDQENGQEK